MPVYLHLVQEFLRKESILEDLDSYSFDSD